MISKTTKGFLLENASFSRELEINSTGVHTVSVINRCTGREYWKNAEVCDFEFSINGTKVSSWNGREIRILDGNIEEKSSIMKLTGHKIVSDDYSRECLQLYFFIAKYNTKVTVFYEIHPDLPGTVKYIEIEACKDELTLTNFAVERLHLCPGEFNQIEFYKDHGMSRCCSQHFVLSGTDDILQLHNPELEEGLYIGNGAPGPLRNFLVYPHWGWGINCGYSMGAADFHKYLLPGEKFVSDRIYMTIYQGSQDSPELAVEMREMIRRDLPECPDKGGVMYCTWLPFLKNINTELLLDLAERAATLGFHTFVVDDGWFVEGYEVDKKKFPNGLEEVSEKVSSLGMKFGLWFNIGTDYGATGTEPGNNVVKNNGQPKGGDNICRCMASHHRDVAAEKLLDLARRYKVDYFKLDFSTICSPYAMIQFGCQSEYHAYHRDGSDSVVEQYAGMNYIRKMIKQEFPDLIIDFSFETFGTERPSIAALQYSELHHCSNMNNLRPHILSAFHIRDTIYGYCGQLPPERILGSLICLQNVNDIENLLSAMSGAPLVAGDLRKIDEQEKSDIIRLTSCVNEIIANGAMTLFQKLHSQKRLEQNLWDGYCRCNLAGYGLVVMFANRYQGAAPQVNLKVLPKSVYKFRLADAMTGREVGIFSRTELVEGIDATWLNGRKFAVLELAPA